MSTNLVDASASLMRKVSQPRNLHPIEVTTISPGKDLHPAQGTKDLHPAEVTTISPDKDLHPAQGTKDLHPAEVTTISPGKDLHPAQGTKDLHPAEVTTISLGKDLHPAQGTKDLHPAEVTTISPGKDLHPAEMTTISPGKDLHPAQGTKDLHPEEVTTISPGKDLNPAEMTTISPGKDLHPTQGTKDLQVTTISSDKDLHPVTTISPDKDLYLATTMRNVRPISMSPANDLDPSHVTSRPMSTVSTVSAPASARGSLCSVNQYKCVVVGDGGVGKTSMLLRFVQGDFFQDYQPTHFDSFTVSMALGDQLMPCTMTLVDTAGQETYDRLRTLTYYDADVFIVCYSVVDLDSFVNVRARWIPELREFRPKTPVILVGTQCDLRNKMADSSSQNGSQTLTAACVTCKEGKRLASKVKARMYSECSALTGEGLDKIFYQALMTAVVPKRKRRFWHRMKRVFAT